MRLGQKITNLHNVQIMDNHVSILSSPKNIRGIQRKCSNDLEARPASKLQSQYAGQPRDRWSYNA
jgi:hypothetical protein